MKVNLSVIVAFLFFVVNCTLAADSDIRLNSLGFLPTAPKKATIISECSTFTVKKANDVVFSGTVTGPITQKDVNQVAWIADFSGVAENGKFYLDVPGVGRSIDFEIGDTVYDFAYYTAMRGFYLWRCGTAVEGKHNGITYSHAACHLEDAFQDYMGIEDTSRRDGTGGWHDAGDYGKYTVNAGVTVGAMFMAWEHFQDKLKNVSLNIPDTAPGLPDFLKEIKWEIDWLLKMRYTDGSGKISHKLTRLNFSGFIMPEKDLEKRYFTDWGSAATADFVAMMAMAARYFKPYDAGYAQTCLDAAKVSYEFLKNNPNDKRFQQGDFKTGGYQTSDPDDRLWAAAEMWETTGEAQYLKDFEARAKASFTYRRKGEAQSSDGKIDEDWDWGNVRNLGMFTYVLSSKQGRNPELLEDVRRNILTIADTIVEKGNKDIYGRPFGSRYYWGCNGTVARQVLNLQVANKISPKKEYIDTSLDAIAHLFGRNFYGRSYVTGLGNQPPMNPHDRRSGADGITEPWPGYLVGGGQTVRNWQDVEGSYQTNEIAINWQGALVYALAGFISGQSSSGFGR
jgi:endoglucanase